MFNITRLFVPLTVGILLSTSEAGAQTPGAYRGFALGASVEAVTTLAQPGASALQTLHRRPSLIQTVVWRRPYTTSDSNPALRDPVKEIEFSFYDDQLYQIVVDYDANRTRGMTSADIVDGLSTAYGLVSTTSVRPATARDVESGRNAPRVIGSWGDLDFSAVAYQEVDAYSSANGSRFKLIVLSSRLAALSRTATAQSVALDLREAPQREVARLKKQADDERAVQDKAGIENKAAFKP